MKIGSTWICDYSGVQSPRLTAPSPLNEIMTNACVAGGFTVIDSQTQNYDVKGEGVTFVILLAESHLAAHSWPEYEYLSLVLDSCLSEEHNKRTIDYVNKTIDFRNVEIRVYSRIAKLNE